MVPSNAFGVRCSSVGFSAVESNPNADCGSRDCRDRAAARRADRRRARFPDRLARPASVRLPRRRDIPPGEFATTAKAARNRPPLSAWARSRSNSCVSKGRYFPSPVGQSAIRSAGAKIRRYVSGAGSSSRSSPVPAQDRRRQEQQNGDGEETCFHDRNRLVATLQRGNAIVALSVRGIARLCSTDACELSVAILVTLERASAVS